MAIDINIPIEDAVTDGSLNPVTSNAVFDALADKANTADLATVATTGDYNDLDNNPTIPAAQVNSDWNATSGVSEILNKPTIPSVTGFVPYTGATNDVDLGVHDLTATQGTFATSGNPDTLTVNHSSGSGNALTITKDGSGEGVYVNKTSGSGNAVTVVGDLEATNLKRTGGTSAQFLKANGSVDSTSYQPTLVSGTDIKTLEGQSILGAGNIDLTKSDVGLSNVDNTSDLNKPISTDTQTALNAKQDTLTLTTTGTSGAATLIGDTLNIPQYGGGGGGGASVIDIQTFTSSGVWTKPAGAKQVELYIFGAGGGGGSGRRGAASSARYGGGGGATGSVFINKLDGSVFSSTENIWIGAGGIAGAAKTTNDTNGVNGGSGGDTYFGGTGGSGDAKIIVTGGAGGAGGRNTANGSGQAPFNLIYGVLGASNTYSTQTNNSNGFITNLTFNMRPLTSGAYGGGIDAANSINNGSSIKNRKMNFTNFYTINGGVAPGGNGVNGLSTFSDYNFVVMSSGGSGGASGDAAGTIAGGIGGNGAVCCGGGGGGASTNGANSGAGGAGGDGFCMIITYF